MDLADWAGENEGQGDKVVMSTVERLGPQMWLFQH